MNEVNGEYAAVIRRLRRLIQSHATRIGEICAAVARDPLDQSVEVGESVDHREEGLPRLLARGHDLAFEPLPLPCRFPLATLPDASPRGEYDEPGESDLRAFLDGEVESRSLEGGKGQIDRMGTFGPRYSQYLEVGLVLTDARHTRRVDATRSIEKDQLLADLGPDYMGKVVELVTLQNGFIFTERTRVDREITLLSHGGCPGSYRAPFPTGRATW
jgi:hypothetical protein